MIFDSEWRGFLGAVIVWGVGGAICGFLGVIESERFKREYLHRS